MYRTDTYHQNLERIAQMEAEEQAAVLSELEQYAELRTGLERRRILVHDLTGIENLTERVKEMYEYKKSEQEAREQKRLKKKAKLKKKLSLASRILPKLKKARKPALITAVIGAVIYGGYLAVTAVYTAYDSYSKEREKIEAIQKDLKEKMDRDCDQKLTVGDVISSYRYATGKELSDLVYNSGKGIEINFDYSVSDIKIGNVHIDASLFKSGGDVYAITLSQQTAQEFASKLPPVQCNLKLE